MINPIQKIEDYRVFSEQTYKAKLVNTEKANDNNVSKDLPEDKFVKKADEVVIQYDIDKHVQILKNMVIPPEDRQDVSILLELELNNKLTVAELRQLIDEVEKKEIETGPKVNLTDSDNDTSKEQVSHQDSQVKNTNADTVNGTEAT